VSIEEMDQTVGEDEMEQLDPVSGRGPLPAGSRIYNINLDNKTSGNILFLIIAVHDY
jgi:hypothetical protein